MRFTYNAYKQLITSLKDREYVFSDYLNMREGYKEGKEYIYNGYSLYQSK